MDFQKGVRFYFCNRMPGYSKNLYKTLAIILLTFAFSSPLLSGIKEAKKAYSQKQFQKAIKLFKEYSEEHPMDGESYMYMGYIYESQKDFPKSIQMFRRAVDLNLDRKHKETSYLKIVLYYNYHQEWDLLVHYANRLLKLNPKQKEVVKMRERGLTNRGNTVYVSPSSQKEKAYSVKEDKDPEKGIHYFEKALAENPEDEDIHWELSTLYFKNENFIKADAMIQWLINKKPTNKNYLYKGGMAKLRLGAFQEAIDLFEEARNNTTEKDAKLLYFINLNEGLAYHKLKNLAVAAKFYRKALALQKTPAPLIALTKLKYEAGDYQNCIGTADQVLDMSPGENEALLYKALSLLKLGNKKEGYSLLINFGRILKRAYSDLNEAPEKYHDGFLKLARFYTNRKKYKVALSYFDAISKTRNQTKEYKFYLGKTQYYSKKPEAAIINLEKIPNSGGANYLMAKSYASLNNIPKTKEYIGKAGEKNEVFWKKAKADSAFLEFRKNSEFISYLDRKIPFQPPKKEEIPKSPVAPSQTNNVLNKPKVAGSEPAKIEPKSNNVQKPQTKP